MEQELELSAVIGFQGKFARLLTRLGISRTGTCSPPPKYSGFQRLTSKFLGKVTEGLVLHPDNEHILFPLGTTIVLRHIISRTQHFLRGHDNDISVITVSNTGKYIASGQKTHSGF